VASTDYTDRGIPVTQSEVRKLYWDIQSKKS
jgi:hypothetical protein